MPCERLGDGTCYRSASIRADDVSADERTATLSFSSETPVREGGDDVVLLHERKSADFQRIREVGAALFNHDPDRIVGAITDLRLDEDGRVGRATIRFDETEEGELALSRVRSGSLRGVSVAYRAQNARVVDEGEEWKSPGGRSFRGPVVVVDRWQAIELSLTPIPADAAVGVGRTQKVEEAGMTLPDNVRRALVKRYGLAEDVTDDALFEAIERQPVEREEQKPARRADDNDPVERAIDGVRAERQRVSTLRDIARRANLDDETLDGWIDSDISVERARAQALDKLAEERAQVVKPSSDRIEVGESDTERTLRAAIKGICESRGLPVDEDAPKERSHLRSFGVAARELCRLRGERNAPYMRMSDLITTRAFSHSRDDFAQLLENVANKELAAGYEETDTSFQILGAAKSLPDFKSARHVKLGGVEDFEEVPELFPITEGTVVDASESYNLATYGRRFSLSRQALINDDLDGFGDMLRKFGAAAARTKNKIFWDHIYTNPTMSEDSQAFFSGSHTSGSNLGSAGAISTTTLGEAKKLMRLQKDPTGDATLNIMPSFLVVPAALEQTADALLNGAYVPTAASTALTATQRQLTLVVEPYIDSLASGTDDWYVWAAPSRIASVIVASLNGQTAPTIVRTEGSNVLGVAWDAYFDFAAKCVDHRGVVKNAGS